MIYFTSDQHFWHTRIIEFCDRPFKTVEEMNEKIVWLYNSIVCPDDTVYHLGDFSMAFRPVETFLPRLNGIKHFISGNHDFCHPAHKKGKKDLERWKQKYIECGFSSVKEEDSMEINGQKVLLHHMPYRNLEPGPHGEKYSQFRLENKGLWLLHGHVHEKWLKKNKMLNVGVDRHLFQPISIDRIVELMSHEGDIL